MTFGFRARNDFGSVQVDDTYCNMAFLTKGRAVSDGSTYPLIAVTIAAENPMMFISPTAGIASVRRVEISGGTWTFYIGLGTGVPYCDWYIFDNPAAGSERFGIRVRRADGKVTFSSEFRYMRMVQFTELPDPFDYVNGYQVAGPAGFSLAVNYTDPGTFFTQVIQQQGAVVFYPTPVFGLSLSGNACTCRTYGTITFPIPPGSSIFLREQTPQALMFIDVTGL